MIHTGVMGRYVIYNRTCTFELQGGSQLHHEEKATSMIHVLTLRDVALLLAVFNLYVLNDEN